MPTRPAPIGRGRVSLLRTGLQPFHTGATQVVAPPPRASPALGPRYAVGCAGPLGEPRGERWDETPTTVWRPGAGPRCSGRPASTHLFTGTGSVAHPGVEQGGRAHREVPGFATSSFGQGGDGQVDLSAEAAAGATAPMSSSHARMGTLSPAERRASAPSTRQSAKPGRSCGDGGLGHLGTAAVTEGAGLTTAISGTPAWQSQDLHIVLRTARRSTSATASGLRTVGVRRRAQYWLGRSHDRGRLTRIHRASREAPLAHVWAGTALPSSHGMRPPATRPTRGDGPALSWASTTRATRSMHTGRWPGCGRRASRRWPRHEQAAGDLPHS